MTLIKPDGENDGAASELLGVVKEHLREVALEIEQCRQKIRDEPGTETGALKKSMADYRTITNNCVTEANRLEEQLRKKAGVVHDYAIDFDSARSEIRQRMAKLRAASGAGKVSE